MNIGSITKVIENKTENIESNNNNELKDSSQSSIKIKDYYFF